MNVSILPFQPHLHPSLPTIEGNVDYRNLRAQFLRIDELLIQSGLESQLVTLALAQWLARAQEPPKAKAQRRHQAYCRRALRCNIARVLLNEDYRGFAARLADSPLLQFFCQVNQIDQIKVPSKSVLQRSATLWEEAQVRQAVAQLLVLGQHKPEQICLPEALDLEAYFLDTTCVKANIHYPVDWVLLRDATRTLMKALRLIRDQGLKHRMEEPEAFLRRINGLCIEMHQARDKADSPQRRKKTLRKMDKVVGSVRNHARRYRRLLDEKWQQTGWTRPQTEQVLRRMDHILEQLPRARQQARQRILDGQLVKNEEKILSLYESEVNVIMRHKPGAEVEFGNTLLLGESAQGLIVDWELFKDSAPGDARLVHPSLDRMEKLLGDALKAIGADRGFDSERNQTHLRKKGIYNGVCPRGPKQLGKRNQSPKFKRLQKRRAQTEGRIGIFKNNWLGRPLRSKGFVHRALSVAWAVLTHNFWVIARLPQKEDPAEALAA
jgi:hypothetical protein